MMGCVSSGKGWKGNLTHLIRLHSRLRKKQKLNCGIFSAGLGVFPMVAAFINPRTAHGILRTGPLCPRHWFRPGPDNSRKDKSVVSRIVGVGGLLKRLLRDTAVSKHP
jgi:hypothetical protein